MAWNEPGGGSGDKNPWGGGNGDQGPPDLDEVVKKMRDKVGGVFGGGRGGGSRGESGQPSGLGGVFTILLIVLAIWLVYDATYVIEPAERGVVLRFGKHVDTLQPGLMVRMPRPFEKIVRVNVERQQSETIGRTAAESLMLTQDENIIDIEFNVQYKVSNAADFVFNVKNPGETLRQATETAVREVVGKSKMDFVITEGRDEIVIRSRLLLQEILDTYGTGLQITEFNMQDAQAPEQVQDAFADAVKAREDEVRYKNEAEAYQRDILGKAQGAAQRTLLDAQAYRSQVIESATGEADRFEKLLFEYEKAPKVTRERLYLETMEQVLESSTKIIADIKGGNNVLYLPLDQIMRSGGHKAPADDVWKPQSSAPTKSSPPRRPDERSRTRGGR